MDWEGAKELPGWIPASVPEKAAASPCWLLGGQNAPQKLQSKGFPLGSIVKNPICQPGDLS